MKVAHKNILKYSEWKNAKKLLNGDLVKQIYLFYDGYDESTINYWNDWLLLFNLDS